MSYCRDEEIDSYALVCQRCNRARPSPSIRWNNRACAIISRGRRQSRGKTHTTVRGWHTTSVHKMVGALMWKS
jgi:hypothetical protein